MNNVQTKFNNRFMPTENKVLNLLATDIDN
jgi:hypothetical protein